jgi:hypothetical protein
LGTLLNERHRGVICVAAENTSGVKAVEDHMVWIEPMSGMVVTMPEENTPGL